MLWISLNKKKKKKTRPIKINYNPDLIRQSVGGFKDKIVSPFRPNTSKQVVYGKGKNLKET